LWLSRVAAYRTVADAVAKLVPEIDDPDHLVARDVAVGQHGDAAP
jgi:hypothetical protein